MYSTIDEREGFSNRLLQGCCSVRVAKYGSAFPDYCKSFVGALCNGFTRLLGYQFHGAYRHFVGVGHIGCDEPHPGVTKDQQEGSVTGQVVKIGDDR